MKIYGRKGFWLGIIVWGLILPRSLAAETERNTQRGWFDCAKTDLIHLPADVFEGSRDTFLRRDNMAALLLAGGASLVLDKSDADDKIARNFERHRAFRGFSDEAFYVVGHSIAGKHKIPEAAGFEMLPYASTDGNSGTGIMLVKRF